MHVWSGTLDGSSHSDADADNECASKRLALHMSSDEKALTVPYQQTCGFPPRNTVLAQMGANEMNMPMSRSSFLI